MILLMRKMLQINHKYKIHLYDCEKWKKMKGSIVTIENKKETECAIIWCELNAIQIQVKRTASVLS